MDAIQKPAGILPLENLTCLVFGSPLYLIENNKVTIRFLLLRCDHVQEHHGWEPRTHEGGDSQRHVEARARGIAGQLHAITTSTGQR